MAELLKIIVKERSTQKVVVELRPTKTNIQKAAGMSACPDLDVIRVYAPVKPPKKRGYNG